MCVLCVCATGKYPTNGWDFCTYPDGPSTENWTIGLQTYVFYIFIITNGVLSLNYFRRHHFELFYYSHHFFIVLYIAVLYHAASAWYADSSGAPHSARMHLLSFSVCACACALSSHDHGVCTLRACAAAAATGTL